MAQKVFSRTEKKYLLSPEKYDELSEFILRRMQPDSYGRTVVCSVYYDTDDLALIQRSVQKPVYKEKLRLRSYGTPDDGTTVFVEIKKKYKGVVYKRRVGMKYADAVRFMNGEKVSGYDGQITSELEWSVGFYKPKPQCVICCDRTALVCPDDPELRVTFDENIRWRDSDLDLRSGSGGELLLPEDWRLMEIKTASSIPLWLCRKLSEMQVFPTSFSKYGTYYQKKILGRNFLCSEASSTPKQRLS